MIPAAGHYDIFAIVRAQCHTASAARVPDKLQRAPEARGKASGKIPERSRLHGDEQLKVFSAVERVLYRIPPERLRGRATARRNGNVFDHGGTTRLAAKPVEIGG